MLNSMSFLNFLVEVENDFQTLNILDINKQKLSTSTLTLRKKGKHKSSWNMEDYFQITISTVSHLNCKSAEVKLAIIILILEGLINFIVDWHSSKYISWWKISMSSSKHLGEINRRN